jgi:hypothetical protein
MNKTRNLVSGIVWLALLIGLTTFFIGLFAINWWGLRRMAALEVGFLISATSIALLLHRRWTNKAFNWIILCSVLQCLLVYFWYESAGTMQFINNTSYYDMQAQAFLHGQLDLLQKPNPKLLALPDPYDPTQNSPYRLHDAVLYNGKYYLYWGPFPALILAGMELVTNQTYSDSFLVLLFMTGYILFLSLILVELRRKTFPDSPNWILVSGILIGGLMNPALWLLARPAIYEAAITGGQFCLLAGIFFALTAFKDEGTSIGKLILSGTFLAFSVLARISLVLGVGWVTLLVGYSILKRLGIFKRVLGPILAFSIPLILGATMLFVYNALRFGSPFEIGIKFTLGGMNTPKYFNNGSFESTSYILPSLNSYFFFPTKKIPTFPFIVAPWNGGYNLDLIDKALNSPNRYMVIEPIAGMITTSPLLWLVLIPILFSLSNAHHIKLAQKMQADENNSPNIMWSFHLFAGLALLTFIPVSMEFTATMRYIFDFSPSWFLLAYLSFMYGYDLFGTAGKNVLVVCFLVLGAITILNGALLGITSYGGYFTHSNPVLFRELVKFFRFFHQP